MQITSIVDLETYRFLHLRYKERKIPVTINHKIIGHVIKYRFIENVVELIIDVDPDLMYKSICKGCKHALGINSTDGTLEFRCE